MIMDQNDSVASNLPQEILQKILGASRSCPTMLKSCSLVNRAWLHASRVILFRTINLTPLLAQEDWLSVFVNMPLNIGDHVREIMVKNARWVSHSSATRVLLLSHFATSVTSLKLSNLTISDFAHFANIVSTLKGLQLLSMQHIGFEHNQLDFSEPIAPNRSFPPSLTSLYLYYVDLGLLFDWIHAHSVVPKLSKAYIGPMESHWKARIFRYLLSPLPDWIVELAFLFPETVPAGHYSLYCDAAVPKDCPAPPPTAHLKSIITRHQARYGVPLYLNGLAFAGNLRSLRIHKFFNGRNRESNVCTVWAARLLVNVKKGFRGRLVLDVEANSAMEIDVAEIDWEFLEDVLSDEIFSEVEAVVFLVLTDIEPSKLESLISLKMPRSYTRGILRFEEAHETTFRPPVIL